MKKICQRCSASFICREDRIDLCGCKKINIAPKVRGYIEEEYGNCLCPNCVKETNLYFDACSINPVYAEKIKKRDS